MHSNLGSHQRIDSADKPDRRRKVAARRGLRGRVQQSAPQPAVGPLTGGVQVEYGRPDLPHSLVELRHGLLDAALDDRVCTAAQRALQLQTGGEQPLNDLVVQIAGDPVPVGEHIELALARFFSPSSSASVAWSANEVSNGTSAGSNAALSSRRSATRTPITVSWE